MSLRRVPIPLGAQVIMATKEAYRQKLEAQLAEWDARLDVLNARARKASADVRIEYENELQGLKRQRERAHETLAELGRRSETAWEDMKVGAERAWGEMAGALEKVTARFK
jgi:hypothetical protein